MDRRTPWLVDALLGLAVTGSLAAVISSRQGGSHGPDALAYLWAAGLGALMFARRTHPRAVLLVSALGLFAYYAADYPAVGIAVPLAAALFSAAEAGRLTESIGAAAGVLAVSLLHRLLEGQDVAFVLGYDLVPHVALMAAAIALGDGLRSRRRQRAQQRELAALTAREERLAIARDLHDSIGHTISVISLHADVAREALGPSSEGAEVALRRIKDATSDTMRELRRTVGLLRADEPLSLTALDPVLDAARSAGFDVYADIAVAPGTLPPAVDVAAYRIVQEALTNVVRHASGASRVDVAATVTGGRLRLTISDDGPPSGGRGTGHGLAGMAERAAAVHGSLDARHEPGGFIVTLEAPA